MRSTLFLLSLLVMACESRATFLAVSDVPVFKAAIRSRTAPNPVVATITAGTLVSQSRVIRGADYRYFEVALPDGGLGYVRGGGAQMHIYEE
jgi:hypothetical protein